MIRINLLPHREARRREQRQKFYVVAALMVGLGAAVALAVHMVIAGYIDRQESKNEIFRADIKKLDAQIAEIRTLREQIDALLSRKQVIESLQSNRAETVHLLAETAKRLPEGIYLKSMKQSGRRITLVGYAQSNARVSTLMRQLDDSEYLERPQLVQIQAKTVEGQRVGEFTLTIGLAQPKAAETEAEAGADKGKGARK